MSEPFESIAIFLLVAVGSGVCWHALIKAPARAIAGAALTTAALYRGLDYWHSGHADLWAVPLFIVHGVLGFIIALLIAAPFRLWRRDDE